CAALLSRQTPARHRLWGVLAIALWLIAMGWSPLGRAFQSLPPFSITANDKLRFVAIFLAAVVGATVLDRLSRWYFLFAALSAAGALYVYALRKAWLRPADLVAPASVLILIVVILTARRHAPAAACLLLLCDLFTLNGSFNALVDGRYFRPRLPIIEALHRLAPHTPYRVAGLEWMFLPNASAQYGLEDVRGSDPMAYARYTNLLAPIVRDEPAIDFDRIVAVQHRLFDLLNVRYLLTEPGVEPGGRWRALYRGADGSLFENPSVLPRFYAREGDADVAIRQERPDRFRLTVQARTPVWIGSGQVAAPGWLVKAGGTRLNTELMEGALMSFRLPAGRSEVEVAYRPVSYWGSVVLSLAVILVGIGFGRVPLSRVPTREGSLENKP
ncbi:MAG: hypothetical protein ABI779_00290, partial [Acidobacteriota bacterium]